jgi:hypothetical protein
VNHFGSKIRQPIGAEAMAEYPNFSKRWSGHGWNQ